MYLYVAFSYASVFPMKFAAAKDTLFTGKMLGS